MRSNSPDWSHLNHGSVYITALRAAVSATILVVIFIALGFIAAPLAALPPSEVTLSLMRQHDCSFITIAHKVFKNPGRTLS